MQQVDRRPVRHRAATRVQRRWLRRGLFAWSFVCLAIATGCRGGGIDYIRPDAAAVGDTSAVKAPPLPVEVTAAVAPADYKTTPEQAKVWSEKMKSGQDFNEMLIRAEVVQAAPKQANQVRLEPGKLSFPIAGNENLLQLKPGAPFVGQPASVGQRRAGKSNNVLGFLRKVKEVKQENGEIVVITEPGHFEDVVVGSAALTFPPGAKELDIGNEVNVHDLIKELPPSFDDLKADRLYGTQRGALDVEGKFGYGFINEFSADLLQLQALLELAEVEAELNGTGNIAAVADVFVGAVFKATVEMTWDDILPHLSYLYAGAGGKAELSLTADIDATFTITKSLEPDAGEDDKTKEKKKGNAKKELTKKPVKKPTGGKASKPGGKAEGGGNNFTFGKPKYYEGPKIYGIPTTFVFTLTGKCDFTLYGELNAHAVAKVAYDAMYAVEYKDGNWGTIEPGGFDKKFEWKVAKAEGGAEVQCEIGPRIDWLFADVAGPFIVAKAMLHGGAKFENVCPDPGKIEQEIDATGKISAFLDVGLKATVGVSIDLFVWSTEYSVDLVEQWWTLWSDSWLINAGFGTCPTNCHDGKKDSYETGSDCGGQSVGGACVPCGFAELCNDNKDCAFGEKLTCQGGKCNNLNCQTGKVESYMSDVNCGGLCGATCDLGKKCNGNADCMSDNCDPFSKQCAAQKCDNGIRDWWETDVDCGGLYCKPCEKGQGCSNDSQCVPNAGLTCQAGGWATTFGACVPAGCDIKQYFSGAWAQKGDMTDVMCGGTCARVMESLSPENCTYGKDNLLVDKNCGIATLRCANGKQCAMDGDCLSNACFQGTCIDLQCSDGVQQPWETDVDCGGKCANKCKLDKGCKVAADCEYSMPCTKAVVGDGNVCSLCDKNGKLDGWETDVDCGAQCAQGKGDFDLCKLGQGCQQNADCAVGYQATFQGKPILVDSAMCSGGKCTLTCYNGQWDEKTESDQDCGGKCTAKCQVGKTCKLGEDCESGGCFAGKCAGKCQNGKKDDGEGGIDCGGTCSALCLKGMACTDGTDCSTGQCIKNVCGFDACKDGQLSPGETDIDCGGATCEKKCALTGGCKADKDCATGFCDGTACVATSCTDKKQSGGEADVDCGGSCKDSATCTVAQRCKAGADCQSQICSTLGKCVATTCQDGAMTSNETDIDCGGVCAVKCTTGHGCSTGSDCDSKYCDGKVCVGDFCSDKVLSVGESDLDCGGACSKKCATGQKCGGNADCASGQCATSGVCVTTTCDDGKLSKGEADVDCGGVCATPCLVGKACKGGVDCATTVCATSSMVCVATPCLDELQDGNETDVDCGGTCAARCAQDKGCKLDADCKSGFCDGSKCVATACETKRQDGDETGVDCGGSCAKHCDVGVGCKADKDCSSGSCDAKGLVCVASQCQDNHLDAGETDVDCGGVCLAQATCAQGLGCKGGADCASGICSAAGKCVATTCDDGKLTPDETGVDCGGVCAQKCTAGQGCKVGGDCDSSFCSAGNVCVGGACQDGKLSPGETGIDCGGPCTAQCATGDGCKVEADCMTGFCDGATCQATACTDKKMDLGETGADCGGPCATTCGLGVGCGQDSDCASGSCAVVDKKCVADSCHDQKLDGSETDVDCGGTCAVTCGATKGCKIDGDCSTTFCDGIVCVSDSCLDNQWDAGESDVDCGGPCAKKCDVAMGCATAADCGSTFCNGSVCVATSCEDKKADFGESDTDCGQVCSAQCGANQGCAAGVDCQSGICAHISLVCVVDLCHDETLTTSADPSLAETDVDCGGPCAQPCTVGKGCAKNADCASGYCDGTVCVADHCLDKQPDVGETGTDCGGTCSQTCDVGQSCKIAGDCTSAMCAAVSLACVATPCLDEAKDGDETDVDCGGAVCSGKCAEGKGCASGGDCTSTFCNSGSGLCVSDHCGDGILDADELGVDCGGSCAGCKDGVGCTQDSDCVSGVCVSHSGNGGALQCGCPAYHKLIPVTSANKKAICAQNYVYATGCSESGISGVLSCQPYEITKQYFFPNDGFTLKQIQSVCDDVNTGGYDDWHMATLPEMISLFPFDIQANSAPAKPNGPFLEFWYPPQFANVPFVITSTLMNPPYPGYNSNNVNYLQPNSPIGIDPWGWTEFLPISPGWVNPGQVPGGNKANGLTFCVRRDQSYPAALPEPRFLLQNNGQVVYDAGLGKRWYRNKYYKANSWAAAKAYCDSVNVDGMTGWRIPTMHELLGIVDFGKATPPYWDTDLFPAVEAPGAANMYSGETFFTSSPLCNGDYVNNIQTCYYQFNPYDLVTKGAYTVSAMCVR